MTPFCVYSPRNIYPTGQNISSVLIEGFCFLNFPLNRISLMSTGPKRLSVTNAFARLSLDSPHVENG